MNIQTIYLDKNGVLQDSCDSIFSTVEVKRDAILSQFPLIKSIFNRIRTLSRNDAQLKIPKIESSNAKLPGFYDFTFECVIIEGKEFIRWIIYDLTDSYKKLQIEQQIGHNRYIANDNILC